MKRIHRKIIDKQAHCILKNIDKMLSMRELGYPWLWIKAVNELRGPNYDISRARMKTKALSKFHLAALFRKLAKANSFNHDGHLEVCWFLSKKVIVEYTIGPLKQRNKL